MPHENIAEVCLIRAANRMRAWFEKCLIKRFFARTVHDVLRIGLFEKRPNQEVFGRWQTNSDVQIIGSLHFRANEKTAASAAESNRLN